MQRISTVLAVAACLAAGPALAQESDAPGFGSVVGGLIGGAIGAAVSGHRPRAGDFVPGEAGGAGSKGKSAGGQHGRPTGGGAAAPKAAHAGGGGGQVRRKQGH